MSRPPSNTVPPLAAPRSTRPTIKTVAAEAGVSVAAVSKVLRNAYGVSEGLRQRVQHAIEKLGYRPSTGARGMRGRTFTIGVLLVEISNPFLPEVIEGISEICGSDGYKVLIGLGHSSLTMEESLLESMVDHGMDGLILVAPQLAGSALERFARQVPMVVIGHHEPEATTFDSVNNDDRAGTALALQALARQGRRDIAMISAAISQQGSGANVVAVREQAYRAFMAQMNGMQGSVLRLSYDLAPRTQQIKDWLNAPDRPSAVFCWSDLFAVELIGHARAMGIAVPQDLAVIGYDNSPPAAMPLIDLTSVDQNAKGLGGAAASLLLSRITGRAEAQHSLIAPSLFLRSSHAAGPSKPQHTS